MTPFNHFYGFYGFKAVNCVPITKFKAYGCKSDTFTSLNKKILSENTYWEMILCKYTPCKY